MYHVLHKEGLTVTDEEIRSVDGQVKTFAKISTFFQKTSNFITLSLQITFT